MLLLASMSWPEVMRLHRGWWMSGEWGGEQGSRGSYSGKGERWGGEGMRPDHWGEGIRCERSGVSLLLLLLVWVGEKRRERGRAPLQDMAEDRPLRQSHRLPCTFFRASHCDSLELWEPCSVRILKNLSGTNARKYTDTLSTHTYTALTHSIQCIFMHNYITL